MGSLTIELLSEKQFEDYILRELKVSDVTVSDYTQLLYLALLLLVTCLIQQVLDY